jgi:uroporphyrinogen decarboxylase
MAELTSKERVDGILRRKPVDRIAVHESFWGETVAKWQGEGHIPEGANLTDFFGYDIEMSGWLQLVADLDFEDEILEETEETRLTKDGNGAIMRNWKAKSGTPEHVDFTVTDRAGWEELIKPHLLDTSRIRDRVRIEDFRNDRQRAIENDRFFSWCGANVFECLHPVCGHEYMLMGMALDPDWVLDMSMTYAELIINCMEVLFDEGGEPDGVFFFEDMGFKDKPFMSPAMYKQTIWPAHKRLFDFCHGRDLPVIVHSCGFVDALVPGLIEAGMDCLQAMEVKAGMDLVELVKKYGEDITFFGGMDVRTMVANDKAAIEAELRRKLPAAMASGGYILHSDHSIPDQVEFETYQFFRELGLELGQYT